MRSILEMTEMDKTPWSLLVKKRKQIYKWKKVDKNIYRRIKTDFKILNQNKQERRGKKFEIFIETIIYFINMFFFHNLLSFDISIEIVISLEKDGVQILINSQKTLYAKATKKVETKTTFSDIQTKICYM